MLDYYIFHNNGITTATENNNDGTFLIGKWFPLYMLLGYFMKIVHVLSKVYKTKNKIFCFFGNHIDQHGQECVFEPIQSAVVSELNEYNPMLNDIV